MRILLHATRPVTVYLRWKEQDLLTLSPLVRLLWGSLIDELITTYDSAQGEGCRPVLLLIDEAGRTAIPSLADHATTVAGRGMSLWIAVQSLSQLEAVYGRARAQTLRDNMETQLYYRPNDIATAQYLEQRLGSRSAYAHATTTHEGQEISQGLSERPIPLLIPGTRHIQSSNIMKECRHYVSILQDTGKWFIQIWSLNLIVKMLCQQCLEW